MQTITKPSSKTKSRGPDGAIEIEDDAGKDPDGGKAASCPGESRKSGLGGLRLEGIVGSDDSEEGRATPPGEGNKGLMSGDRTGGDAGALGKIAGAAEIVETFIFRADAEANEE